jgi:AcrR family transcriptional regulator
MARRVDGTKTRAALVQAAQRITARHGVETLTIRGVVKEAGVSVGSFYVYFPSLEDLRLALLVEALTEGLLYWTRQIDHGMEPAAKLRHLAQTYLLAMLERPQWFDACVRMKVALPAKLPKARGRGLADAMRASVQPFRDVVALGQNVGRFRQDLNARTVGTGLWSAINGVILVSGGAPAKPGTDLARRAIEQVALLVDGYLCVLEQPAGPAPA